MSLQSPGHVSHEQRWLYAAATIIFLLAAVVAARSYFVHSVEKDWETLRQEVDDSQATVIGRRLDDIADDMRASAERMLGAVSLHAESNLHGMFAEQFRRLFLTSPVADYAFELRDTSRMLWAYSGVPLPAPVNVSDSGSWMAVSEGTPYSMLLLQRDWLSEDGTRRGSLRLGTPLSVTVPVNRRFLDSEGIVEMLARELELDLRGEPLPLTRRPSERVYVNFAPEGETLAVFSFEGAELNAWLDHIGMQFDRVLAFLLLALAIIVSIPLLRLFIRLPFTPSSLLLGWTLIWGIRYGFVLTGYGALLLPVDALDPSGFAASFGGGIASSPGELSLSLFALLVSVVFFFLRALRDVDRGLRTLPSLLLLLIAITALPWMLRCMLAVLRSIVIDSSFNFDDVGALFDNPIYVLMIANSWLLALAFGFGFLGLYLLVKRSLNVFIHPLLRGAMLVTAAFIGLLTLVPAASDTLLPVWVYVLLMSVFMLPLLSRVPLLRDRSSTLSAPFLITVSLGSIIAVAMFSNSMEEKRASEIEAIAIDLSRPVDGWSQVLMEQALQVVSRMQLAYPGTAENGLEYETAFRVWSASPLSRLQNNSAILLLDTGGVPISRFAVGNDPFLLSMHMLETTVEMTEGIVQSVYRRLDDREKRFYKGYTDIQAGGRRLLAVVILEALDPMQTTRDAVDLLRSTPTILSLAPEDEYIVSRFHSDTLQQTSHPLLERGYPLPADVLDSFKQGNSSVWGKLRVEDEYLHTYFSMLPDSEEVLAITRGKSEALLSMYRWLRIAFIFMFLSFSSLGITAVFLGHHRRLPRFTFGRKLQLALLGVAAIPLLLIWVLGRDFAMDITKRDMEQQVLENLEVLRSNIVDQTPDSIHVDVIHETITDQLCQEIRLKTGKDINVYRGPELLATSKPELYHVGLLNNRLNPEAWLNIVGIGRDVHVATEQIGTFSYYVGYRALRDHNGTVVAVISTPTLFERNRAEEVYVRASAAVLLWIALIAFIVLLVSAALSRQISRPLSEFLRATRDITAGDLDRKVRVKGSAEILDLMNAFNTMTERLRKSQEELAAAERELAWREMAKQVAHEIRNPLTPMKLAAQHLQRAWRDGAAHFGDIIDKVTRTLVDQIDSLSHISDEFSRFARMPRRNLKEVDVAAVLGEVVALFRTHEHIHFELHVDPGIPKVHGDHEELSRAFTNLIRNAVQAIGDQGNIVINAGHDGGYVGIRIDDSGAGIDPDLIPRIFEPNFSTRTEGMGLGLAIVKKIITDTGGRITIESTLGEGTTVHIVIPAQERRGNEVHVGTDEAL